MIDMFSYKLGQKAGGGSGGGADWNAPEGTAGYIKNRTHYEEVTEVMGDTLTWDGNTEGLVSVDLGGVPAYRVSAAVPTIDDCSNGVVCGYSTGSSFTVTAEELQELYLAYGCVAGNGFFIAPVDGFNVSGIVFPVAGVYVSVMGGYVNSLTIPNYTGFKTVTTTLKTIDPKYLPEALQFGEEIAFEPIVWDGNTEGLESIDVNGMVAYKIADYFDGTQIGNVTMEITTANGDKQELQGVVTQMGNGWVGYQGTMFGCNGEAGMLAFPKGIWHVDPVELDATKYSVTITPKTVVTPIDKKYLPEGFPYSEKVEKVLFEADFELVADSNGIMGGTVEDVNLAQTLIIGRPYKFIINGTAYENVVGKEYTGSHGGIVFVEMMYGFRFWAFGDGGAKIEDSDSMYGSSVTLVIADMEPEMIYHPIPEECLPILTSPSGKKYKLTVDDSGTVSAVEVTE